MLDIFHLPLKIHSQLLHSALCPWGLILVSCSPGQPDPLTSALDHWGALVGEMEERRDERRQGRKKGKRKGWVFCSSILSLLGLPWWFSGKESACHCRRHGFEPWVGKIPWGSNWNGNPFQYSCLENSIDQGASWSIVHGVAKESDTT